MAKNIFNENGAIGTHLIYGLEALTYSGMTVTSSTSSSRIYTYLYGASTGNTATYEINVTSGVYNIYLYTLRGTSQGIVTFLLDGVAVGTQDNYKSSTEYNYMGQVLSGGSPLALSIKAGRHTLTTLTNTKNASASGYNCCIYMIKLVKVSDEKTGKLILNEVNKSRLLFSSELFGATRSFYQSSNHIFYQVVRPRSTEQVGDFLYRDFTIGPGNYIIRVCHREYVIMGIATISIDGVTIGTLDAYKSTDTYNLIYSTDPIKLSGSHVIKLEITGKNASSSAYRLDINYIQIVPTEDAASVVISKKFLKNKFSNTPTLIPLNYADSNINFTYSSVSNIIFYYFTYMVLDTDDYLETKFSGGGGVYNITFYYWYRADIIESYDFLIDGVKIGEFACTDAKFSVLENVSLSKGIHTLKLASNSNDKYSCASLVYFEKVS